MTPAPNPLPLKIALSVLEIPVAVGAAFATFVLASRLGCVWARCVDMSGLPIYLFAAVLGMAMGVACWSLALHFGTRWRARIAVDCVIIVLSIVAVKLPEIAQLFEGRQRSVVTPSRPSPPPPAINAPVRPETPPANISR